MNIWLIDYLFANPVIIGALIICTIGLLVLWLFLRLRPVDWLFYFDKLNRTGSLLHVKKAYPQVFESSIGKDVVRLYRRTQSWGIVFGWKLHRIYLFLRGTAYAAKLPGKTGQMDLITYLKTQLSTFNQLGEEDKAKLETGNLTVLEQAPIRIALPGYLKTKWGPKFYNTIPEERRSEIEGEKASDFYIAVDPEPDPPPDATVSMSEIDTLRDQKKEDAGLLNEAYKAKGSMMREIAKALFIGMSGAFVWTVIQIFLKVKVVP